MQDALIRGEYKISMLLDRLNLHVVDDATVKRFDDGDMFFNINYREDLEQAERMGKGL